MQIKIENLKEKCELHFHATVEGDEWKNAQQKAIEELAKNVTVKGFRKGHAPLAQAMRFINPSEVLNKAADKAIEKAYNEMVGEKNNIRPFIQPELVIDEFKSEKLVFHFVIVNVPDMEVGEYKGIEIPHKQIRVLKSEIETELNMMADKNAELIVLGLDEPAIEHDTVVIDFKGYVDGEAFDGGQASSFELELGSHVFVPGFEEQLLGVKTNEDREVNIKFPENYVADLANKDAKFEVHVNAIKRKEVPAIDEDFVADLDIDGVENLEDLNAHVKAQIKTRKTQQQENDQLNALIDQIVENSTLHCHDRIIEEDAKRIIDDFKQRITGQGFDLDDYLKMTGKKMEELEEEAKKEALKNTKRAYLFEKIAKLEKIGVKPDEVEAKLNDLATQYHISIEEVKHQIGDRINAFAYNMKQEKVLDFLKANNKI